VKKNAFFLGIMVLGLVCLQARAQAPADEKLFQDAKILLFDEKWDEARQRLDDLLADYPNSALVPQAVFYRAKCLAKQKGKQREALRAYEDYLRLPDKNRSFMEEAETSIIDLSFDLASKGEKSYLSEIEERLQSPNRVVSYYAAFKLSQAGDNSMAAKAIPVLKRIIEEEKDSDLRDRARIALMRVSPSSLKDVEDREGGGEGRVLKIRVMVEGEKEPVFSINIPWVLADLALQAIPEEDRASLREAGYDLDKIIDQLTRLKAKIEIANQERVIKIWIDQKP
jgi:tetratricopeptide (TPR) repeat protein